MLPCLHSILLHQHLLAAADRHIIFATLHRAIQTHRIRVSPRRRKPEYLRLNGLARALIPEHLSRRLAPNALLLPTEGVPFLAACQLHFMHALLVLWTQQFFRSSCGGHF